MWETSWKTVGGCRVPVHPGQGHRVQGRGGGEGDGCLADDHRKLQLKHRVPLAFCLWAQSCLPDLSKLQWMAEPEGKEEVVCVTEECPG